MSVQPTAAPSSGRLDTAHSILNNALIILACIPPLPTIFFLCSGVSRGMSLEQEDIVIGVLWLVTLLTACLASALLPPLGVAGFWVAHQRKAKLGKPYRWWIYPIVGLLWIIYVGVVIFVGPRFLL